MSHRRTRLLARTFYGRLFENDLFSSSVSASNGVLWLLAALATPGVMFSASQMFYYAHVQTFAPEVQDRVLTISQTFHVAFAMAVAGVVTMLVWTSLTPDRRDALVLGPLPLRTGEQSRARLLALTRFFLLFAVAVAVPTAVAFSFLTVGPQVSLLPGRIAGHVAGTMLAAAFVFFAIVDVQLLIAATVGPRGVATLALPLQAAALVSMVVAFSSSARLADGVLAADAGWWVLWNPAAWFVGVYRWVAGDPRATIAALAWRGATASLGVVALALLLYPVAYQRCLRQAIDGVGRRSSRVSGALSYGWLRLLSIVSRTPLERGLAAFLTATLTRSHAHRFLVGGYLGVAVLCALPLTGRLLRDASTPEVRYAWFSLPLGMLCWSSAALRVAMLLPVEPAANWIFQLTEPVDKRRVLSTVTLFIVCATAVPLALTFGLGAALRGGPTLGLTVAVVVTLTGLALVELLTLTMHTVPCTCTYRPGQLRLRVLWPLYLTIWIAVAYYVLPELAVRSVGDPQRSLTLVASLTALWLALRMWRLSRARLLRGFVYEELEEAVTTTLELGPAARPV